MPAPERLGRFRIGAPRAPGTGLGCIRGVHFHEPAPGPCCLVRKLLAEESPGLFLDGTVQAPLLGHVRARLLDRAFGTLHHVGNLERLDGDGANPPHNIRCGPVTGIAVAQAYCSARAHAAFEFLVLTACRPGEVRGTRWE